MTVAYAILIPGLIWSYKITILANQHQRFVISDLGSPIVVTWHRICYQLFKIAIGADVPTGVLTTVTLILSATTKSSGTQSKLFRNDTAITLPRSGHGLHFYPWQSRHMYGSACIDPLRD